MQFLTVREFSKSPKAALSKLAQDGKAILTNNGKPAAIMFYVTPENFEDVLWGVKPVEQQVSSKLTSRRGEILEELKKFRGIFQSKEEILECIREGRK